MKSRNSLVRVCNLLIIAAMLFAAISIVSCEQAKLTPNDEQIKQYVVDQLVWDNRLDASNIQVAVSDGKVVLNGTVMTPDQYWQAEKDVTSILGVSEVENNLTIEVDAAPPTDEELKDSIYATLKWNADLDFETEDILDIDVYVSGGFVTLKGNVDSYWKKVKVENLVGSLWGVRQVTNELAVVPTERITDEVIASYIISALERNIDVNAEEITVEVKGGVVTLSGAVDDWTAKYAARDAALATRGVIGVINKIMIY